jgi:hypothetical protein
MWNRRVVSPPQRRKASVNTIVKDGYGVLLWDRIGKLRLDKVLRAKRQIFHDGGAECTPKSTSECFYSSQTIECKRGAACRFRHKPLFKKGSGVDVMVKGKWVNGKVAVVNKALEQYGVSYGAGMNKHKHFEFYSCRRSEVIEKEEEPDKNCPFAIGSLCEVCDAQTHNTWKRAHLVKKGSDGVNTVSLCGPPADKMPPNHALCSSCFQCDGGQVIPGVPSHKIRPARNESAAMIAKGNEIDFYIGRGNQKWISGQVVKAHKRSQTYDLRLSTGQEQSGVHPIFVRSRIDDDDREALKKQKSTWGSLTFHVGTDVEIYTATGSMPMQKFGWKKAKVLALRPGIDSYDIELQPGGHDGDRMNRVYTALLRCTVPVSSVDFSESTKSQSGELAPLRIGGHSREPQRNKLTPL